MRCSRGPRERERLLDTATAVFLDRLFPPVARRHGAEVLAMGLAQDHVHIVLHLDAIVDIPHLVQGLSGGLRSPIDFTQPSEACNPIRGNSGPTPPAVGGHDPVGRSVGTTASFQDAPLGIWQPSPASQAGTHGEMRPAPILQVGTHNEIRSAGTQTLAA